MLILAEMFYLRLGIAKPLIFLITYVTFFSLHVHNKNLCNAIWPYSKPLSAIIFSAKNLLFRTFPAYSRVGSWEPLIVQLATHEGRSFSVKVLSTVTLTWRRKKYYRERLRPQTFIRQRRRN